VIGNIKSNGGKPSVESVATQLSGMHSAERAPVMLALQQTHGNRYVQRVVSGIQAKLVVGQPGDKYEQEADRVADAVMRMPEPGVKMQIEDEGELLQPKLEASSEYFIQRRIEEEDEEDVLQTKNRENTTSEVANDPESQIQGIRDGGQPLPQSARAFFEPRFGHDFSQVRVHNDTQAAESAEAINALAYTIRRDVVFGAGQYSPGTSSGRKLLAHELTHVIQQNRADNVRRKWELSYVPHFLQQATVKVQPVGSVPSPVVDGIIQRTATVRRRRIVDNRPDLIRFEIDRPADRDALIAQIRTDIIATLSRVVWPPIWARIRDLRENLGNLLDQTEGQRQIVFELSVVWSSSTTVDHVSLQSPYVEPEGREEVEEQFRGEQETITDPVQAIRQNPDYVELRTLGVGIFGLGGPFRLDLEINIQTMEAIRSIYMDRSKFALVTDPFSGNAEVALTPTIYSSEADAQAAVASSPLFRQSDYVVYTHYRGAENIIFPTIMSETTTPNLIRALRLAVEEERQYAQTASTTLFQAFFTLLGVRYAPTARTSDVAAGVAGELATLRGTARLLVEQSRQTSGRVVVNLAGSSEVPGAINVNPLIGQQVRGIPNLLRMRAERIGEVFPPGSIDSIVSNDVVLGQINWATTARGCFTALDSGGSVSIAPYAGQLAEHISRIVSALRAAGFREVTTQAGRFVTAVKP
jgi:hypothetical protein